MLRAKTLFIFSMLAASQLVWNASAEAGPLLDWLRGGCGTGGGCGLTNCCRPAQQCFAPAVTCQQTCCRTVVNYVPCTSYRTCWERVPVTQYRQTSTVDPCTGCTTTCNRPCTTFCWRMKQVPFTTYRPVYRRECFQTPVSMPCDTGCNPCGTACGTGFGVQPQVVASPVVATPAAGCNGCAVPSVGTPVVTAPTTTVTPGTTYAPYYQSTPNAADQQPTLAPVETQRPPIILNESSSSTTWPTQIQPTQPVTTMNITPIQDPNPAARWNNNAPQLLNPFNKSASAPSVERWNYSPVRLASHEEPALHTPAALERPAPREHVGSIDDVPVRDVSRPRVNEGWRTDGR
ncbi:MAG: hypothetical protein ACR2NP_02865 [Pirellulaceae bacterium]